VQGFGVFVREIDDTMLAGKIDIAVHSMKDVPTERPAELTIAAVMKRDSPYDFLLTRNNTKLKDLRRGDNRHYKPQAEVAAFAFQI